MTLGFVRGRWVQPRIKILEKYMKYSPLKFDIAWYAPKNDWVEPNTITITDGVKENAIIRILNHELAHWATFHEVPTKSMDRMTHAWCVSKNPKSLKLVESVARWVEGPRGR